VFISCAGSAWAGESAHGEVAEALAHALQAGAIEVQLGGTPRPETETPPPDGLTPGSSQTWISLLDQTGLRGGGGDRERRLFLVTDDARKVLRNVRARVLLRRRGSVHMRAAGDTQVEQVEAEEACFFLRKVVTDEEDRYRQVEEEAQQQQGDDVEGWAVYFSAG
jgi:hypothetical protein